MGDEGGCRVGGGAGVGGGGSGSGSWESGVGIGSVSVGGEGVWLRSCVSGINLSLPIHFRVKDSLVERE